MAARGLPAEVGQHSAIAHPLPTQVAIKTLLGSWLEDKRIVERFREEISLMSTLQHPNVLQFIGAVVDDPSRFWCAPRRPASHLGWTADAVGRGSARWCPAGRHWPFPRKFRPTLVIVPTLTRSSPLPVLASMVAEFCQHGSLDAFLRSSARLNWRVRLAMATDVARGMHYLHLRAGVIQRDLKTANLLVDENYSIKIADFGLSRRVAGLGAMETYCGTPATMVRPAGSTEVALPSALSTTHTHAPTRMQAPEIVRQERYSEKADVFSFGVILWELLTRETPYGGMHGVGLALAVAQYGLRPPIPGYCPREYADLIAQCWTDSASARPDFGQVLDTLQGMRAHVRAARDARTQAARRVRQQDLARAYIAGGRRARRRARRERVERALGVSLASQAPAGDGEVNSSVAAAGKAAGDYPDWPPIWSEPEARARAVSVAPYDVVRRGRGSHTEQSGGSIASFGTEHR